MVVMLVVGFIAGMIFILYFIEKAAPKSFSMLKEEMEKSKNKKEKAEDDRDYNS